MFEFLFRKLMHVIMVLIGVTLITFLLMHAIPGSPWSNYANSTKMMSSVGLDASAQKNLNHRFGLDLPMWRQFIRYMIGDFDEENVFFCGAICGNLGPSLQQRGRTVEHILFVAPEGKPFRDSRFGYSIRLVLLGSLIAVGFGIPLGILSASQPRSARNGISIGLAALISIPNFVLGLLTIIVLASGLKIIKVLPDWNYPSSWIVPAIVLAVVPMANIARVTNSSLRNVMNEDYIRTARAKGLTRVRVMVVHVMRNALVPILTFLGPTLMEMLTGLLVVENLYSFPGFGREYWAAVLKLDYPMILGLTLIYATAIVFIHVLIDVLAEVLDPRIRSAQGVQS